MIKISKFYLDKSHAERKLCTLQEIIGFEKLLKADNFSLTGNVSSVRVSELGSVFSSIEIVPELSDKFHDAVIQAIKDHIIGLKKLDKQIDSEREQNET